MNKSKPSSLMHTPDRSKPSSLTRTTDQLKQSILFRGLSEEGLRDCLTALRARERVFAKGEAVFHAGDRTDRMGLLLTGSVTIESSDLWGNRTILSHAGAGDLFAETYAMLPNAVMLVDVVANEDCRILFLNIGEILNGTGRTGTADAWREPFLVNLLRITAGKNLQLSGRSFHTAPKSCRARLLSYLNAVSLQKGSAEFDIPFNRQQLADYLNLERTNMSKELSRMQREGILECRKNHFRLVPARVSGVVYGTRSLI